MGAKAARLALGAMALGGCALSLAPMDPADAASSDAGAVADEGGPAIGFTEVSTGIATACAVRFNGEVWCWGDNHEGQFGTGPNGLQGPTRVPGLEGAVHVACGEGHACAVRSNGEVWCWGLNASGELGDASRRMHSGPVQVTLRDRAVAIAAGVHHACAVLADGSGWCWGDPAGGTLGDGTSGGSSTGPVRVAVSAALQGAVSAGYSRTCALTVDNEVECWGDRDMSPTVISVPGLSRSVAATLSHSCARNSNGEVWCWGDNASGALGDGTMQDASSAVRAVGLADAVDIAVGTEHTCAVRADGQVLCWGDNVRGELGDGTLLARAVPTEVSGLSDAVVVRGGEHFTCAIARGGGVWCWGFNNQAQLGITAGIHDGCGPDSTQCPTPVRVPLPM